MSNELRGMLVEVYRPANTADCTNEGMSSRYSRGIAVHALMDEIFSARDDTPAYLILPGHIDGWRAVPADPGDVRGMAGPMFGGNFLWTSDSRFGCVFGGPVPIHDRWEVQR